VTLGASPVGIGWKIIRTSGGTRWLHITGSWGTNATTESHPSWYIADKPLSWNYRTSGTTVNGSENGAWVAPATGWYLFYAECARSSPSGCTPTGSYSAIGTDNSGCSHTAPMNIAVYSNLGASLGGASYSYIHTGVSNLNVCYAYMTPAQFDAHTAVDADEAWVAQTVNKTTMSFTPGSDPGSNSGTADGVRADLQEGDPDTDFEIGQLVDGGWQGPDNASLIERYAPVLRLAPTETFWPSKADLATDTYQPGSPGHTNELTRFDVPRYTVATADGDLSLDYLGDQVGFEVQDELDYPNWSNDDPIESATYDYAYMLDQNPDVYENWAYARVYPVPGSADRIIQYWFFYYYNQKQFNAGQGDHEGDWEWIQVRVDETGEAVKATFSQHGNGERCLWPDVTKTGGDHIVVWPAVGSHANYFYPDDDYPVALPGDDGEDSTAAANDYLAITPQIEDVTTPPAWLNWEGRWGSSGSEFLVWDWGWSPESPPLQDPWIDPVEWEGDASSCSVT